MQPDCQKLTLLGSVMEVVSQWDSFVTGCAGTRGSAGRQRRVWENHSVLRPKVLILPDAAVEQGGGVITEQQRTETYEHPVQVGKKPLLSPDQSRLGSKRHIAACQVDKERLQKSSGLWDGDAYSLKRLLFRPVENSHSGESPREAVRDCRGYSAVQRLLGLSPND